MSTLFLEYTLSDHTTLPGPPPPSSWTPHPECPSLLINHSSPSHSTFPPMVIQKTLRDPDTGEAEEEPVLAIALLSSELEGRSWKIDTSSGAILPRTLPYHTPPPPRFQFHQDLIVEYQHSFKVQPYGDELRDITNRPEDLALHNAITIDSLPTDHFWAGEPEPLEDTTPLTEQEITEMAEEFYSVTEPSSPDNEWDRLSEERAEEELAREPSDSSSPLF